MTDLLGAEPPSGFMELLGYRVAEWRDGHGVIVLDAGPRHLNRAGVVHGGVLTTLIDTACGFSATFCPVPGRVRRVMTLSLTVTFTGQAGPGPIRAVGTKRGGGTRIFACSADVLDADGRLVAVGQGSFRYHTGSERPEGVPL